MTTVSRVNISDNVRSIIINNELTVPYKLDTGATLPFISTNIITKLTNKLKMKKIKQPFMCELAALGLQVQCKYQVQIPIMEIETIADPLILRDVRCYVIDGHMPEILLGDNVMKELGINVDAQLSSLAGKNLKMGKTLKRSWKMMKF